MPRISAREVFEERGAGAGPPVRATGVPYPGDEEAMKEFVAKGRMIGTVVGPKGFLEIDKDAYNYQKELQDEKFVHEAQKLWKKMKNKVIEELREKGFDV
ncbi:hypothetical protein K1719_026399 [Acacia pycnantha]|nr:hypothetical protein K1719_026399 [Acacia pycnantha]